MNRIGTNKFLFPPLFYLIKNLSLTRKNQYHEYFTIHYSCPINLETHEIRMKKIRIGIEIPIYSDIHSLITSQAQSSQSVSYLPTKKEGEKEKENEREEEEE